MLADQDIRIVGVAELDDERRAELARHFQKAIFPALTPLAVAPGRPFPYISNLSLSLAVLVRDPVTDQTVFARVKVPTEILPRFVTLRQPAGEPALLVPLEDVIANHLDALFPGMEIADYDVFRVTRDADLEVSDDAADLLQAVEDELRRRRFGEIVRVEVGARGSEQLRSSLDGPARRPGRRGLPRRRAARHGRAVADRETARAHRAARGAAAHGHAPAAAPATRAIAPTCSAAMREGDVLVHHPYDSFATSVERFVEQAVADPNVLAIKQTVYRTSDDSPLVPALIDATERGKQAVALVELQARFDERMNIHWAKAMEEAGVHVVYGQPALKTHAKCVLVVRREGDGVRNYVHIGTGNYHSATARLYTDFGLFTIDEQIGADVADMFNYLTGYGRPLHYRTVLIAPNQLRDGLHRPDRADDRGALRRAARADRDEDERARRRPLHPRALRRLAGRRAGRPQRARHLLPAPGPARASPRTSASCRSWGACSSTRACTPSSAADEQTIFIASADLMPRNLDHRVELAVPIDSSPSCRPSCWTRSSGPSPTTRARGSWKATAAGAAVSRHRGSVRGTCSSSSPSCTRRGPFPRAPTPSTARSSRSARSADPAVPQPIAGAGSSSRTAFSSSTDW